MWRDRFMLSKLDTTSTDYRYSQNNVQTNFLTLHFRICVGAEVHVACWCRLLPPPGLHLLLHLHGLRTPVTASHVDKTFIRLHRNILYFFKNFQKFLELYNSFLFVFIFNLDHFCLKYLFATSWVTFTNKFPKESR